MRRLLIVPFFFLACDSYELARNEKLSKLTTCEIPLGTPPAVSTPGLILCDGGGVVVLEGSGTHSVYGDPAGPWMRNALLDPDGCGEGVSDVGASRAFWVQVRAELRERLIVINGEGTGRCGDVSSKLLTISLVDWADLDATIELVNKAMTEHHICSRVAVEVRGLMCARAL